MATIDTISGPEGAKVPSPAKSTWLRSNWGVLLAVAALIAVIWLPTPEGLSIAGQRMLAVLAFAVIVWMTEALDYAVSAVVIAALMAFLLGLFAQPRKSESADGHECWPGFGIQRLRQYRARAGGVSAFSRRRDDRDRARQAHRTSILSRVGGEVHHVVVGAILVGFVIAFLVPSTTARVACLVPITLGIISAFGVNKKGAFASMLMITTVQTASIWNVGIKTAAAQNMVAVGFIEKTLHRSSPGWNGLSPQRHSAF